MKLYINLPLYMPSPHAKFHQNWWSGFWEILSQDTEGHSFIIIRIKCISLKLNFFFHCSWFVQESTMRSGETNQRGLSCTTLFSQLAWSYTWSWLWSSRWRRLCGPVQIIKTWLLIKIWITWVKTEIGRSSTSEVWSLDG